MSAPLRAAVSLALAWPCACSSLNTGRPPEDAPPACDADLGSDRANCGACGRVCAPSEVCAQGACGALVLPAPRLVGPLTGATTRSRTPRLRWALNGGDGAHVALCRDRAMTDRCVTFDAAGSSGSLPASSPLEPGVWFWRASARLGEITAGATSPVWSLRIGTIESALGSTLDLDADGRAEIAVGAPRVSSFAGRVYIYRGVTNSETPPWLTRRGMLGSELGGALAGVGDINGDGFFDLAAGASASNRVLVYSGAPGGLSPAVTTLTGEDGIQRFGDTLSGAGDLNGDGFDDVVVGLRDSDDGMGRAYVYEGSSGGLMTDAAATLSGERNSLFGRWVSGAGDVNGDGFEDLAVGAPGVGGNSGAVQVFHGGPDGVSAPPSTTLVGIDVTGAFGTRVARAGDVNGDGYGDLFVSAPLAEARRGKVFVYYGSASGLGARVTALTGGFVGLGLGGGLAAGADLNGDGHTDLIAGGTGGEVGIGDGAIYAWRGGADGIEAEPFVRRRGLDGGDVGFGFTITACDHNGDGLTDLVVGAVGVFHNTGRAYLYLGEPTGLGETPLALIGPDGVQGVFGWSLASWQPQRPTRLPRLFPAHQAGQYLGGANWNTVRE